jgi:hypothetical protein
MANITAKKQGKQGKTTQVGVNVNLTIPPRNCIHLCHLQPKVINYLIENLLSLIV